MKGHVMVKYFRMCSKLILVTLVVMLLVPQTAKADELGDLKKQVAQQQRVLKQLQRKIEQLEASSKAVDAKIAQAVDAKQVATLPDSLKWVDSLKWSGDLRYRHEYIDDETSTFTRNRQRVRARLKLSAEVNDEVDVTVRLASGSDESPTSTNQSLGDAASDGFSSKELWLDMAYADWHPNWLSGTNIIMGKMEMPFYKAGKNQMIWDGDLTLEGIAVKHKVSLDSDTTLNVNGGGFWVAEDSGTDDISIFAGQGYLQRQLAGGESLIGGVSFYDYGNMKGNTVAGLAAKGNTLTGTQYANDFNIFEAFGEYAFTVGGTPTSIYGSYVNNLGAINNSEDSGWIVGAKYNKAKAPGSWEIGYNYRNIEADAVVGGLNDGDFAGGGTNGKGHQLGYKYQLSKKMQGAITYSADEKNANTTEDNYQKLHVDLIYKF